MMIGAIPPGEKIKLGIWRQNKEVEVTVELGEFLSGEAAPTPKPKEENTQKQGFELSNLGLTLTPLSDQIKEQTKLKGGLLVLRAQGAAARSGLASGDIIVAVGQTEVLNEAGFKASIEKADGSVALLVRRGEDMIFVPLKVK